MLFIVYNGYIIEKMMKKQVKSTIFELSGVFAENKGFCCPKVLAILPFLYYNRDILTKKKRKTIL